MATERQELEEALAHVGRLRSRGEPLVWTAGPEAEARYFAAIAKIESAARKHLDTLPKTVTKWRITGRGLSSAPDCNTLDDALADVGCILRNDRHARVCIEAVEVSA